MTSDFELPWNGQPLSGSRIAFDTETTLAEPDTVATFVLATATDGDRVVVIHPDQMWDFVSKHVDKVWVGFNWAFDYWVVKQELRRLISGKGCMHTSEINWSRMVNDGQFRDLMILDQLIRLAKGVENKEGVYPRNLGVVAAEYAGVAVDKTDPYRLRFSELLGIPTEQWSDVDQGFFQYATVDAVATLHGYNEAERVATRLETESAVESDDRWGLLTEQIQIKSSIALADISRRGVMVDQQYIGQVDADMRQRLLSAFGQLSLLVPGVLKRYKRTGKVIFNKRTKLPELYHDVLRKHLETVETDESISVARAPKTKKITLKVDDWTGPLPNHPIVNTWSELVEQTKLFSYVVPLHGVDILRSRYNNLVRTGRVSASPIQQMPRQDWIRRIFVPRPGYKLLAADYSAIELCTLAATCLRTLGRSKLAEVLKVERDPHVATAAEILGLSYDAFTGLKERDPQQFKFYRQAAKAINFGVPGGLMAEKLARYARVNYGVDMSVEQADRFRTKLITEIYPELEKYLAWDVFTQLSQSLKLNRDVIESAWWYGGLQLPANDQYMELVRIVDKPTWTLWVMEKIVRGHPVSRKGIPYGDWIVNKTWNYLAELVSSSPSADREIVRLVSSRLGGQQLHSLLFTAPAITLTGRIRGRARYTEIKNTPFQGLAADGSKLALWSLVNDGYRVVAFIHDEILTEVKDESEVGEVIRRMKTAMESVLEGIPAKVSWKLGDYWSKP